MQYIGEFRDGKFKPFNPMHGIHQKIVNVNVSNASDTKTVTIPGMTSEFQCPPFVTRNDFSNFDYGKWDSVKSHNFTVSISGENVTVTRIDDDGADGWDFDLQFRCELDEGV